MANARLGQSYIYDTKEGAKTHTNWFSLSFHGEMAKVALRLEKGDEVNIVGAIQQRQFTPKDGSTRTVYEVVVKECRLVGKPRMLANISENAETGIVSPNNLSNALLNEEELDDWAFV